MTLYVIITKTLFLIGDVEMLLFEQTKTYSYRDPAAYIENGIIHMFFTLVENMSER